MSAHTENINTDNLVPGSTDMLVGLIKNTDKVVSSNKRWEYDNNRNDKSDKSDNNSNDGELDVDVDDYIDNNSKNVFKKDLTVDNQNNNNNNHHTTLKNNDMTTESTPADTTTDNNTSNKPLTKKELMLKKLNMLRKLGELKKIGVHLSQNYNLDSDLEMMEYEYKLHHDIRSKQNSVQWMSHMLIGVIKGTEMINDNYNPFDIKLKGLSNVISSDMHNYYTVLGDIYEKYNKPGKQMAPEMRLMFMISGAVLSMQVNRAIPGMANMINGGFSKKVKNDNETLQNLRKKAEEDTHSLGGKTKEYLKNQHNAASQKVADLQMIKDKELEHQMLIKMMDKKNNNMKNFKQQLILSSESPNENEYNNSNNVKENDIEQHQFTPEQIEHIKTMKYRNEQAHLEMMRKMAHQNSEYYRTVNNSNFHNEKRQRDLLKQNNQLGNILQNIDKFDHVDRKTTKNKKKLNNPMSKNRETDNDSNASSISFNPNLNNIMKKTQDKALKESKIKTNKESLLTQLDILNNKEKTDNTSDDISKDKISFGSSSKKQTKEIKKQKTKRTHDIVDFGTISFGSNTKGEKVNIKIS